MIIRTKLISEVTQKTTPSFTTVIEHKNDISKSFQNISAYLPYVRMSLFYQTNICSGTYLCTVMKLRTKCTEHVLFELECMSRKLQMKWCH